MNQILSQAFNQVSQLSSDKQAIVANYLLEHLEDILDEAEWERSLNASQAVLQKLADEARRDIVAGNEKPLDEILKNS